MPTRGREARRSTRQETRERIITTATELMRRRSYSDLSVGELMREAGFGDTGRTIFYRHFDDLGDLLVQASREAIDALDRKSTRLNSSHLVISYAVFCLKK